MKDIYSHSLVRNKEELDNQFSKIVGEHGTRIIISNIRKTTDKKPEFDFETDAHDIRIPDDTSSESETYRKTKRQNHVPECDYSLRVSKRKFLFILLQINATLCNVFVICI